jgi:hypothetical protein
VNSGRTLYEKPFGSSPQESKSYPVGDYLALLGSHIPVPYESLVHCYGVYGSSSRGKQKRENKEDQDVIDDFFWCGLRVEGQPKK